MKAMVFAAGLGSRLRPLTDVCPKALVEVGGIPLLQIVLERLKGAGVREVVVNVHHFGEQIEAFLERNHRLGLTIHFSRESELLDTGGGFKAAAARLAGPADETILLHNVDVLSDIDLIALVAKHRESGALATLAVKQRDTGRPLLFDANGTLCGRVIAGREVIAREPSGAMERFGFCGIHAVSSALLPLLTETGAFSIIDSYLRLTAEGRPILAFRADGFRWRDAGRPGDLRPLD